MDPDSLDMVVGAVFLQQYNDRLHPVAFVSKKCVLSKRNYAPHDKELLEIFKACQK